MRYLISCLVVFFLFSCKKDTNQTNIEATEDLSEDISAISTKDFREFKVLDSRVISLESIWQDIDQQLQDFTEDDYNSLKDLIVEADIPTLQSHVAQGKLSYESLTKFYLYRIKKFDRENDGSLNSVIAINPNAIAEAKVKDYELKNRKAKHPVFGMPILLKDNINAKDMPTTAGALALKDNHTGDAYSTERLKSNGANCD